MRYSNIRLCLLLMLRAFCAISIVVLMESLFLWRGILIAFAGEEALTLSLQLKLAGLIFVLFCIVALPVVFHWAQRGKLNLFRCIALGGAFGIMPAVFSVIGTLASSGELGFSWEAAGLLQTALEFALPVAGLFWVFGEVTDALFPAFDRFSRGGE